MAGLFFGVAPILNTLMAECFPPELRGSGPGVVSTIALVGRFFGPIIAAQCIVMAGGHTGAFTYFAGGSLLVAGILVLIILPKTGGKVGDPIGKKG